MFPSGVFSPISYGFNIQAKIAYVFTEQYLPFDRMSEFLDDVCNLKISQDTLCSLLKGFDYKALPVYKLIAKKVEIKKVVESD